MSIHRLPLSPPFNSPLNHPFSPNQHNTNEHRRKFSFIIISLIEPKLTTDLNNAVSDGSSTIIVLKVYGLDGIDDRAGFSVEHLTVLVISANVFFVERAKMFQ